MRRFARGCAIFLVHAVVWILVACAPITAAPVELTLLGWRYDPNSAEWQEVIEAFGKDHPNIKVNLISVGRDEQTSKLLPMVASGKSPDIVWTDAAMTLVLAQQGILEELTPYIQRSSLNRSHYPSGGFVENTYQGGLYAFPSLTMSYLIFYNQDLFDKSGVAYPKNDWDIEEFIGVSRKLTKPEKRVYAFDNRDWITTILPWVWAFGGDWFTPDRRASLLNSPGSIQAHQFLADLIHVHRVSPSFDLLGQDSELRFERERLAMIHSGSWDIRGTERTPSKWDFRWSAVLPPKGPAGQFPCVQTNGWAIVKQSKNKAAAWTFLEWFNGPRGQSILAKVGEFPAHLPTAREAAFLHLDSVTRSNVFLAAVRGRPFPVSPAWEQSLITWVPYRDQVLRNEKPAAVAMKEAAERINKIIQEL